MSGPWELPEGWLGVWEAPDGRILQIERVEERLLVTLRPSAGAPPFSSPRAEALPAEWTRLGRRGRGLRVEVGGAEGLVGLGPTYDLFFVRDQDGRPAAAGDPPAAIRAEPSVTRGLYDDYEEDLGVPWALPLLPWRRRADPR